MAKDAVTAAVAAGCEQPLGSYGDLAELPGHALPSIPTDVLGRAFNISQRSAYQPPYAQFAMDPLPHLLQQIQTANPYSAPGIVPLGAGLPPTAYPAYPYVGLNWLMRDAAQLGLPQSLPFYQCQFGAGAPQIPAAWGQRMPDKQNVLAARVPASQAPPGWTGYPASLSFPQAAACDMRAAAMQGVDYNGAGGATFMLSCLILL
jgi:hypothetical protein